MGHTGGEGKDHPPRWNSKCGGSEAQAWRREEQRGGEETDNIQAAVGGQEVRSGRDWGPIMWGLTRKMGSRGATGSGCLNRDPKVPHEEDCSRDKKNSRAQRRRLYNKQMRGESRVSRAGVRKW